MNPDDMILVSVDDHIAEPANMFRNHVPSKYLGRAPEVRTDERGIQQWWYGDLKGRNLGLNAVAGKPPRVSTTSTQAGTTRCVRVVSTYTSVSAI